jgi:hypothetical protein
MDVLSSVHVVVTSMRPGILASNLAIWRVSVTVGVLKGTDLATFVRVGQVKILSGWIQEQVGVIDGQTDSHPTVAERLQGDRSVLL